MSIRQRLTALLLISLGALVLLSGAAVYIGVRAALLGQFDDALAARSAGLISATQWDDGIVEVDFAAAAMPWYTGGPQAEYFQFTGRDSAAEALISVPRSSSLGEAELALPGAEAAGAANMPLPDGRRGRGMAVSFRPVADEPQGAGMPAPELVLTVARGREELDRTLGTLLVSLFAVGGALGAALVGLVGTALRRGLRPLEQMGREVRAITAHSLARRLETESLPAELRPVGAGLNELLARLEEAFARERRFTAAAAHELRTPVAELRSMLEVALARPRSAEENRRWMEEAQEVTVQMSRLVESLFALAHQEGSSARLELAPVDVAKMVRTVCARHERTARERGGSLSTEVADELVALADAALLESALENIIENAVTYATPVADVRVRAAAADGRIEVDVRNPAEGMTQAEVERLFEPFWRRSNDRSERDHLGLGLSVARTCIQAQGGSVDAAIAAPGWIAVRLALRAATAAREASPAQAIMR
jgi:signal transduction histidine kinase